jgi:deazaflavin-dependent oxidoreductase (nitroreductase family)
MPDEIRNALANDRMIDITTIGRRSRVPRRKEIWYHRVNGQIFITGRPGRRDWFANLIANPEFTFHLKESIEADLPAIARAVTDREEKTEILGEIVRRLGSCRDLGRWVEESPLVEVTFPPGTLPPRETS